MPQEIERKFLVDTTHPELAALLKTAGTAIRQGYLRDPSSVAVETGDRDAVIRIAADGAEAHELAVPAADATEIATSLCRPEGTSRVLDQSVVARIRIAGEEARLTIKGRSSGIARAEFGYPIPLAVAEDLLSGCGPVLRKTRYVHSLPMDLQPRSMSSTRSISLSTRWN